MDPKPDAAAATLSCPATPDTKWPKPELSMGARYDSIDIPGRYKFWEIKANSPAHQAWKTISIQIKKLLEGHAELLAADMLVEMFMAARDSASSCPTILFRSNDKVARQAAMDLVNESSILAPYPGIFMVKYSQLPTPLVFEDVLGLPHLPPGIYSSGSLKHCGIPIIASGGSRDSLRRATLGGIVRIDGLYYGLTTANASVPFKKQAVDLEAELDSALQDLGWKEEITNQGNVVGEMTSKGSISSASTTSRKTSQRRSLSAISYLSPLTPFTSPTSEQCPNSNLSSQNSPRFGGFFSPSSERGTNKYANVEDSSSLLTFKFGSVFATAPDNGRGWALVTIENPALTCPEMSLNNRRFMMNSIYWRNQSLHTSAIYPTRLANEQIDTEVLICSGNRHDPLEGRLSISPSFQKIPGTASFQECWVVKCISAKFTDGDCGSWVVSPETGDLYGMIAAGYSGTETAYIIPAIEIFQDIDNYFGQSVDLSTPEMWGAKENPFSHTSQRESNTEPASTKHAEEQIAEQDSIPIVEDDRADKNQRRTMVSSDTTSTLPDEFSEEMLQSKRVTSSNTSRSSTVRSTSTIKDQIGDRADLRKSASPTGRSQTSARSASSSSTSSHPTSLRALRPSHRTSRRVSSFRDSSVDSGYHSPPCASLWVRNLPLDPNENELRALFSQIPGYRGLRMKLLEPECFVQFKDISSACIAQQKFDDHRLHPEDAWGLMVGFARHINIPYPGQAIRPIEEEECMLPEVYIPRVIDDENLPEVYIPPRPDDEGLPEVYIPEPMLAYEPKSYFDDSPSPVASKRDSVERRPRGLFAQMLSPSRRRSSSSALPAFDWDTNEVASPVQTVDKMREEQERLRVREAKEKEKEEKRREKLEKKEKRAKERERERKAMGNTDQFVRWGP